MQTLSRHALLEEWGRQKARPVHYLCGEETSLKEAAVRKLEASFRPEAFNFSVRDAELADLDQVLDEAGTVPMLADLRFVVLRRVEKLKKEPLKKLLAYLENPCPSACLVLLANWPREKQDPIPAALCGECAITDFSPLTPAQAAEHLNGRLLASGVKTDSAALDTVVELLGTDLATLDAEAEKIAMFMHGQTRFFTAEDAAALAGYAKGGNPFEFANAVCSRNAHEAAAAAARLLEAGAEPLGLLAQITRAIERILKVRRLSAGGEGQSACYQAGLSPGQFYAAQKDASRFTDEKLVRSLRRCLEAEELLKSSSKRDPALLLKQLAVEIAAGK